MSRTLSRPSACWQFTLHVSSGVVTARRTRNYHVVRDIGPQDIQIVFLDTSVKDDMPTREVLKGELVGTDPFTDTAVVKVYPVGKRLVPMRPLPLGKSSSLEVGQSVFAIGNPFGLDHSMHLAK